MESEDPAYDRREKLRRYAFKDSVSFESVEEMDAYMRARGRRGILDRSDFRPASGVIARNCFVVDRNLPLYGHLVIGYFLGATGDLEAIRHTFTLEDSTEVVAQFLASDEFQRNKFEYLAQHDVPPLELAPATVASGGNPDLEKLNQEFFEQYHRYLRKIGDVCPVCDAVLDHACNCPACATPT